jgi:hypothetical protein
MGEQTFYMRKVAGSIPASGIALWCIGCIKGFDPLGLSSTLSRVV